MTSSELIWWNSYCTSSKKEFCKPCVQQGKINRKKFPKTGGKRAHHPENNRAKWSGRAAQQNSRRNKPARSRTRRDKEKRKRKGKREREREREIKTERRKGRGRK